MSRSALSSCRSDGGVPSADFVSDMVTAPVSAIRERVGKIRRKKLPERTLFVLMNLTLSLDARMVLRADLQAYNTWKERIKRNRADVSLQPSSVGAMPQTLRPLRDRPGSARGPWKHDQTSGGRNQALRGRAYRYLASRLIV